MGESDEKYLQHHDVCFTNELINRRREGSLRRSLSDIATLTTRNLRLDLRNPGVTIGNTLFPISLLLIFTASLPLASSS